jgi:hypothetical protein
MDLNAVSVGDFLIRSYIDRQLVEGHFDRMRFVERKRRFIRTFVSLFVHSRIYGRRDSDSVVHQPHESITLSAKKNVP